MAFLPAKTAVADVHPDAARAAAYALVARLFRAPLDQALLERITLDVPEAHAWSASGPAAFGRPDGSAAPWALGDPHEAPLGGEPPLAAAYRRLRAACRAVDEAAVREEFDGLFSGIGSGAVSLYGSQHRPATQIDRSRVDLRQDLSRLGLALRRSVHEPEDHVSVLCEVMRWLIVAAPRERPDAAVWQRQFFERHLWPWQARLADGLDRAPAANFYRVAGRFARALFEVEAEAFGLDGGHVSIPALESHHDHA